MTQDDRKRAIRDAGKLARSRHRDRDAASRKAIQHLMASEEYRRSGSVLWYVDIRDEVQTRDALPTALSDDKVIGVPYCVDDALHLFRLQELDDLAPGRFGVLEPRSELKGLPERRIDPQSIDLVVVPGVAFDERGGRVGYGGGFYDRLLSQVRRQTVLAALAFECQIFPEIPVDDHDVRMDCLVTEDRFIRGLSGPRVRAGA